MKKTFQWHTLGCTIGYWWTHSESLYKVRNIESSIDSCCFLLNKCSNNNYLKWKKLSMDYLSDELTQQDERHGAWLGQVPIWWKGEPVIRYKKQEMKINMQGNVFGNLPTILKLKTQIKIQIQIQNTLLITCLLRTSVFAKARMKLDLTKVIFIVEIRFITMYSIYIHVLYTKLEYSYYSKASDNCPVSRTENAICLIWFNQLWVNRKITISNRRLSYQFTV
jgi:hypothetical protein